MNRLISGRTFQREIKIVALVGNHIDLVALDEIVVTRFGRKDQVDVSAGIEIINRHVTIARGAEIDGDVVTFVVVGTVIFVGPDVDIKVVIAATHGRLCRGDTCGKENCHGRDQRGE